MASEPIRCNTDSCASPAVRWIFWPGRARLPVCAPCAERLARIGAAMGFYVEGLPIEYAPQEADDGE